METLNIKDSFYEIFKGISSSTLSQHMYVYTEYFPILTPFFYPAIIWKLCSLKEKKKNKTPREFHSNISRHILLISEINT